MEAYADWCLKWQTRTAKGFVLLSVFFFLLALPINHLAAKEGELVRMIPRTNKLYGMD